MSHGYDTTMIQQQLPDVVEATAGTLAPPVPPVPVSRLSPNQLTEAKMVLYIIREIRDQNHMAVIMLNPHSKFPDLYADSSGLVNRFQAQMINQVTL